MSRNSPASHPLTRLETTRAQKRAHNDHHASRGMIATFDLFFGYVNHFDNVQDDLNLAPEIYHATQCRVLTMQPPTHHLHTLTVAPSSQPLPPQTTYQPCPSLTHLPYYRSIPHISLLLALSSLAAVRLRPHLSFTSSNALLSSAFFASPASATNATKNCEQSNFSAKRFLVHSHGSSFLSLLISSISGGVRWYFFSFWTLWDRGGKRRVGSAR